MKKRMILVGACLVACVGALVVSRYYPSEAAPEASAAPQAVPVNTAEVQVGDVPIVLDGIGTVAGVQRGGRAHAGHRHDPADRFRRRPDGAQGRFDRATRSAAISGGPATGRSEPRAR